MQSLHRMLTGGGSTHNAALMDFYHNINQRLWPTGKSQTPACHCIGFGKSIDDHGLSAISGKDAMLTWRLCPWAARNKFHGSAL